MATLALSGCSCSASLFRSSDNFHSVRSIYLPAEITVFWEFSKVERRNRRTENCRSDRIQRSWSAFITDFARFSAILARAVGIFWPEGRKTSRAPRRRTALYRWNCGNAITKDHGRTSCRIYGFSRFLPPDSSPEFDLRLLSNLWAPIKPRQFFQQVPRLLAPSICTIDSPIPLPIGDPLFVFSSTCPVRLLPWFNFLQRSWSWPAQAGKIANAGVQWTTCSWRANFCFCCTVTFRLT